MILAFLENVKRAVREFATILPRLKAYLQDACFKFYAGFIVHSLDVWHSLTPDREMLSTVMGLKIEFDSIPHQHYIPLNNKRSVAEEVIVPGEIDKLLTKHVIEPAEHSSGEIISDIFSPR